MTQDTGGAAARPPADLDTRVARSVFVRFIPALLIFEYAGIVGFLITAPDPRAPFTRSGITWFVALLSLAVTPPIVGFVWWGVRRGVRRRLAWARSGGVPSDDDKRALLRMPWTVMAWMSPIWFCTLTFGAILVRVIVPMTSVIRAMLVVVVYAVACSIMSYVLVEDGLRPAYAYVLEPGRVVRPRLVRRLLLAMAAAISLPVGWAIYAPGQLGLTLTQWVAILTGLLVAIGLVVVISRGVSQPLGRLEQVVRAVGSGDLSVEVPVNDAGEVGQLQLAVAGMVDGLRERERLHDLFGRHVGTEVARRELERGGGLGGQTLEVTALFVDLVGSTRLAQAVAADDVVTVLNRFFDVIGVAVAHEGGIVSQFHGDGALCIFGAPDPQPDHAARGLRAARAIAGGLGDLDAGIGVSTGEVVAGNVGTESRHEYTVIGDPVNEASRLCDESKLRTSRVAASGRAVAAAGSEAQHWTCTAAVQLRGRTTATEIHEPRTD